MEDDLLLPKLLRALDLSRYKQFRIRYGGLLTGVPVPVLGDYVKCTTHFLVRPCAKMCVDSGRKDHCHGKKTSKRRIPCGYG